MKKVKITPVVANKAVKITLLLICLVLLEIWTRPQIFSPASIKIYDRNHLLLYETSTHYQPVKLASLPTHLIQALIASEDTSFWSNPGFDPKSLLRAAWQNIQHQKIVSGASTITQQLVRQSFPTSRFVYLRKIREILTSVRLTLFTSKQTILESYLNTIYFGANSYGIESASQTYFGKSSSQLSLAESALLIGLISSPEVRNPRVNFPASQTYQALVLDRLVAEKYITPDTALQAGQEKLDIRLEDSGIKAPHFVHYVLSHLPVQGKSLKVHTTLDYPLYELSRDIAKNWIGKLTQKHDLTNASLVLLENRTGQILVMLGGIDYFDLAHSGMVNMSTSLRQPGSSIKPITYAAALAQKIITPATVIYDIPKVYTTAKNQGFLPQNYDGRYHGMVSVRTALASSLNLPAVEILSRLGLPAFFAASRDLGITSFTDTSRFDLAITLGGGEVSLLELTNAFASFGRQGNFLPTYAISQITDDHDQILYSHSLPDPRPVFGSDSRQVSFLISDILSDPDARMLTFGQKNPLVLDHPTAVKTGTTTDWHDNWTIGYTPSYTLGVWVGNNDNRPMRDLTGIVGAAPIWNQFFTEFLKGKPVELFARPEGIIDQEVCSIDGYLPGSCPEKTVEKFISGTQPQQASSYPVYPAEVYSWIRSQGLSPISSSAQPFVRITYPLSGAAFQTAPAIVYRESLLFEVSVSSDISSVSWYLNDRFLGRSDKFPFSFSWTPAVGIHTLKAVSASAESDPVTFTVTQFPN